MKYFSRLKKSVKTTVKSPVNLRNYKGLIRKAVVLGIFLLLVSGYLSYTRLYLSPQRRFWMAIENNLSTSSVVRETESGGTGNKTVETTRFAFGAQAVQDKINNVSLKSATAESNVTTETVMTLSEQFVRYNNIFSTEKKTDGSNYNFAAIQGVWAKQDAATGAAGRDEQRLTYIQPLITLAPFGNLTPRARRAIVKKLKDNNVYTVDFAHPAYDDSTGEMLTTYDVSVKTKRYVTVLQDYLKDAGFGSYSAINPSAYPDSAEVQANFIIRQRNSTIASLVFSNQTENYSDYGITQPLKLPSKTVSLSELQNRLQSAQ